MKEMLWRILAVDRQAKREAKMDQMGGNAAQSDEKHLAETAGWLARAQDSSADGGVSRSYKTAKYRGHGPYGWQASYPETTGYIIPTMIALSRIPTDTTVVDRAIRMADWEIEIQLDSGAVMGSVVTAPPSPAVFNTGQVIFGWLAAFKKTEDQKYLNSAIRAGDYLFSVQETDGSWKKGNSKYALNESTTYNTRVAWALIELGLEIQRSEYIEAGKRNIDYALTKQKDNGWFSDNCLNDPNRPLLHTIAYATQGILESGICLNESKYIDAGLKTLDALLSCQREDGGLPGRLASDWSSEANWDCVTGDAQVAVTWLRAYTITNNKKYREAARRAIDFIKRTQNLEHPNPGIRGGVKGSFPFDGPYGQYEMLSWAAKFFCDAVMMLNNEGLAKVGIKG
jgi:uncharacterized protein YyaL (SSP411 family)